MILIIGPAYSGKSEYAHEILERCFSGNGKILTEVQEMVSADNSDHESGDSAERIADILCSRAQILTASETGAGIVPMGADKRRERELQGKLISALARRADCVIRVFYGFPEILKGKI